MERHEKLRPHTPPIVLVELGRPIPKYVKKNLQYLRNRFPHARIILITDQKVHLANVEIVNTSTFYYSVLLKEFDAIDKIMLSSLQKNYWISTTRRFFYLEMLMSQFNISRIIHIESDILILNIDALYSEADLNFDLAFSMQNKVLGCAGIFIINSLHQLRTFLVFINRNWEFKGVTDMSLLANYYNLNKNSKRIRILSPTPLSMAIPNHTDLEVLNFDPGDFGIFFFGNDARHNRVPIRKIRQITNQNSFAQLQTLRRKTKGTILSLDHSGLSLNLNFGDTTLNFNTIHMHAKTLPKNLWELKMLLKMRNASHKFLRTDYLLFPFISLDFNVFLERFLSFSVKRRIVSHKYHDFRRR